MISYSLGRQFQPQLCLTGHIHEAVGKDKIGSTIIVNSGMLSDGGYTEIVKKGESLEVALKKGNRSRGQQQILGFPFPAEMRL